MTWPPSFLPQTATPLETAWTAATLFGVLVAGAGVSLSTVNLRAARRAHHRITMTSSRSALYRMITGEALRNEWIAWTVLVLLLIKLVLLCVLGALAMVTPEPIRPEVRWVDVIGAALLIIDAALLVVAVVLLTVGSMLNRRNRHQLTNRIAGRLLREEWARRQQEAAK
jgi:hypothetical protein